MFNAQSLIFALKSLIVQNEGLSTLVDGRSLILMIWQSHNVFGHVPGLNASLRSETSSR